MFTGAASSRPASNHWTPVISRVAMQSPPAGGHCFSSEFLATDFAPGTSFTHGTITNDLFTSHRQSIGLKPCLKSLLSGLLKVVINCSAGSLAKFPEKSRRTEAILEGSPAVWPKNECGLFAEKTLNWIKLLKREN